MSKFTDNASEKLLVVAGKISNQKHMASIKNAFYTLMPVILTGAFCTLISNVVCSTTTTGISLAKLPGMSWLGMFTDLFNAANYATLNFFTVADGGCCISDRYGTCQAERLRRESGLRRCGCMFLYFRPAYLRCDHRK